MFRNPITPTKRAPENLGDQGNIEHYVGGMRRHLQKKLDIFNHINDSEVRIFLDLGCASGDLLQAKYDDDHSNFENLKDRFYIGVDISPEMIEKAKSNTAGKKIIYFKDLDEALIEVSRLRQLHGGKCVMTMSSVLHEVIHYQPEEMHSTFWSSVWGSAVDYVAIRDFSVDEKLCDKPTPNELVQQARAQFGSETFPVGHPLEGRGVLDVWESGYNAIPGTSDPLLATPFSGWGSIERCDSFIHFLMTYEYLRLNEPENYNRGIRELHENYTALPFQKLCRVLPITFKPTFIERGVSENRNRFFNQIFGQSRLVNSISPTKGMMVFQRRSDLSLKLISEQDKLFMKENPVTRVMIERCMQHLLQVISKYGGPTEYLRATEPDKNVNLDQSVRL